MLLGKAFMEKAFTVKRNVFLAAYRQKGSKWG